MGSYALVDIATGVVKNAFIWDGSEESGWTPPEGYKAVKFEDGMPISEGWTYDGENFHPPYVEVLPPTDDEMRRQNVADLKYRSVTAEQQKAALVNRIGTLQDAIDNIGVEGQEDYAATPEEQAELPVRKSQLTQWKNYAIVLGRVSQQSGWAVQATWPKEPAKGMDLTINASISPQAAM